MAARKDNGNKARVARLIIMSFVWVAFAFLVLSCVSYNASDPGSSSYVTLSGQKPVIHNWCHEGGARVAHVVMTRFGPGVFIGLVMLGIALVQWTRGERVKDLTLRFIGTLLMMLALSSLFFLVRGATTSAFSEGGVIGVGVGQFLYHHFGVAAWLIIGLIGFVGALLAADEFVLALPARWLWVRKRLPTDQVATVTVSAAGGMWSGVKSFVDTLTPRGRMGSSSRSGRTSRAARVEAATEEEAEETELKINPSRRGRGGAEDTEKVEKELAIAAGTVTTVKAKPVEEEAPAKAEAEKPKAAEESEEDIDEAKAEEVVVRKAPKPAMLPFKPPAPPAFKPQDLGNYRLPGLDLLDEAEPVNTDAQEVVVREKAKVLESTLESYGVSAKVEAIDTGPVVTLYELSLATGVKTSQVAALSKDLARALASPPVRIIDNIPGKSTMGIEVPNLNREGVRLKELFQLGHDQVAKGALPMCLGKDASGNPLIEDLTKMPHMLIAGTTGSGKSVCINSIIMTILLTQRPDHVKLIMVDPKMVEMQDYKNIPHLMAPIIDDMSKAESILEWATQKMDERYEIMSEVGVRNIKDYNKLSRDEIIERFGAKTDDDKAKLMFHMPFIVIIIDELADLMMTSKEVEGHIVRIAQKARAVGIHLILATQRPEAQVVTGLIKSNMPGRICFQVRSRLDSRIMLDQSGGELLLGKGDMMFIRPTTNGMVRGQGTFVDDQEIKRVCKFLKEIAEPEFHPELMQLGSAQGLNEGEEKDPLFNDAVDVMVETGRGSVSLIQRRLAIGYTRASRIMDQMRRLGIVGAYKGSMASEVTVTAEQWAEMKVNDPTFGNSGGSGEVGQTGVQAGEGASAGYAQQFNSNGTDGEATDDDGVPDEMPGEHRL